MTNANPSVEKPKPTSPAAPPKPAQFMLSHLPAAEQERLRIRWQRADKAKAEFWKQGD